MRSWTEVGPWVSLVGRVGLGGLWIAAGASKASDLAAAGRSVNAYRLLPYDAATFLGAALPFMEIALGVLLIIGLATRMAAVVSVLLLVTFIGGIVSAWARGLRIDCGCFGGGGDLAATQQTHYMSETIRDIVLLTVAGFLVLFPSSRFSLDARLLDGGPTK